MLDEKKDRQRDRQTDGNSHSIYITRMHTFPTPFMCCAQQNPFKIFSLSLTLVFIEAFAILNEDVHGLKIQGGCSSFCRNPRRKKKKMPWGSPWFGFYNFYCTIINKFFENLPEGCCFFPPPPGPMCIYNSLTSATR
jgi:hypothetical protein